MQNQRVLLVVGARPNYMKIAPIYHAMRMRQALFEPLIVHTGQHYDANMSDIFFKNLDLPAPHVFLGVGSGSHAEQTAKVLISFEKVCLDLKPTWIIVAGDVNSTLAAALVASKLCIRLAHVEAGLRSYDRTMPEEINRIVIDALSDLLLTPSIDANENLGKEGIDNAKIAFVGNVMIDAFEMMRQKIEQNSVLAKLVPDLKEYFILTLHRPANVNSAEFISNLLKQLKDLTSKICCIFPIHPNTRKKLLEAGLWEKLSGMEGMITTDPMGYVAFMKLVVNSRFVITDSGGIQEETTYLGIPCITLRPNTERPITITCGTNELSSLDDLPGNADRIISGKWNKGSVPLLWDGHAAERIVSAILDFTVKGNQ